MVNIVFYNIEVNTSVTLVGISVFQNLLYQFLLFNDMSCGVWLYRWWQNVQCFHSLMVAVGVMLSYFHRFKLFQTSLFCYFVIAVISVVFKVSHVGDVTYITHLII